MRMTTVIVAANAPPPLRIAAGTLWSLSQDRKPAPAPVSNAKIIPIANQTGTRLLPDIMLDASGTWPPRCCGRLDQGQLVGFVVLRWPCG
jgi:hypothetical protein